MTTPSPEPAAAPPETVIRPPTGWQLISTDAEVAAAHSVRDLQFAYSGVPVWNGLSNEDPVEDYANSFAQYFLDPNQLRDLSPERYQFVHDHVATDAR